MDERLIARIERTAGVAGLVEALADRLSPTDLQSLLLAVHRRRVSRLTPAGVLAAYARNRFTAPSALDPLALVTFDRLAFGVLAGLGFTGVELSPVAPLGTVTAVATVDQTKVLSADRNCEVLSDSTNSLALECAVRRQRLLRADPRSTERIRVFASHRLVRGQRFTAPGASQHFRMLALTTAGRDEGSYRFQAETLVEQLDVLLRILAKAGWIRASVSLTDLSDGLRRPVLTEVLDFLAGRYPDVELGFDDARTTGRGYYTDACFHIHVGSSAGTRYEVGDGGFTTWTAQLLGNAKERLLVSSLGTERLVGLAG
ncbi:MAG: hypothetical protein AUI14_10530 [Actinobacteria bacterium 13_2_20CM_2_71_6]|nr:MAG: hypothetical protein AUI14_10530 [Actinobacteria bacterium 13_2_20CM_2_71_6]